MRSLALAVVVSFASAASAQIVNGSFENPNLGFRSVANGVTYGGWTCSGPNDIEFVQTVVSGNLPGLEVSGYDGQYWIDLCGVGAPSGIFQMVPTVAGQAYEVSFAMAANVWGSPGTFNMNVLWNGQVVGSFSHTTGQAHGSQMNWTLRDVAVTGTGQDRLEFRATTGFAARGPALDDVQMRLVPAPGALTACGLAGLAALRRRR